MTTQEAKSDGPAVLSSVELGRVDKFDHPDHGWVWRDCEVEWIDARVAAAVLAERERCALVCEALSIRTGRNRENVGSLEGDTGYECADAILVATKLK